LPALLTLCARAADTFLLLPPATGQAARVLLQAPPPGFQGWVDVDGEDGYPQQVWDAVAAALADPGLELRGGVASAAAELQRRGVALALGELRHLVALALGPSRGLLAFDALHGGRLLPHVAASDAVLPASAPEARRSAPETMKASREAPRPMEPGAPEGSRARREAPEAKRAEALEVPCESAPGPEVLEAGKAPAARKAVPRPVEPEAPEGRTALEAKRASEEVPRTTEPEARKAPPQAPPEAAMASEARKAEVRKEEARKAPDAVSLAAESEARKAPPEASEARKAEARQAPDAVRLAAESEAREVPLVAQASEARKAEARKAPDAVTLTTESGAPPEARKAPPGEVPWPAPVEPAALVAELRYRLVSLQRCLLGFCLAGAGAPTLAEVKERLRLMGWSPAAVETAPLLLPRHPEMFVMTGEPVCVQLRLGEAGRGEARLNWACGVSAETTAGGKERRIFTQI